MKSAVFPSLIVRAWSLGNTFSVFLMNRMILGQPREVHRRYKLNLFKEYPGSDNLNGATRGSVSVTVFIAR